MEENPNSRRARQLAAGIYLHTGQHVKVLEILSSIGRDWPDDSGSHVQLLMMKCLNPWIGIKTSQETINHLKTSAFDRGAISALRTISDLRARGRCQTLSYDYLVSLLEALITNPNFSSQHANLYAILGAVHSTEGQLTPALAALEQAQKRSPNPYADMMIAQLLMSVGRPIRALAHIQRARESAKRNPLKAKLLEKTLDDWEQLIKKKTTHQSELIPSTRQLIQTENRLNTHYASGNNVVSEGASKTCSSHRSN